MVVIDVGSRRQVVERRRHGALVIGDGGQAKKADGAALPGAIEDEAGGTAGGDDADTAKEVLLGQGIGAAEEDDAWRRPRGGAGFGWEEIAGEPMALVGDAHGLKGVARCSEPAFEAGDGLAIERACAHPVPATRSRPYGNR